MKDKLVKEPSAQSRTNQLRIIPNQDIAEKLFQYLFNLNKGIECFELKYPPVKNGESKETTSENECTKSDFFQKRHRYIKKLIKEKLSEYGNKSKYSDIQYFLSYSDGKTYVFFLSPNKSHSGWQKLFKDNRERILNLVFKFYLLNQVPDNETISGFENFFIIHSTKQTKSKDALFVWGQDLYIKWNYYDVLTLTLTRKHRRFLSEDQYMRKDSCDLDLGDLLISKNKKYYHDRDLDARRSNSINFMVFPKDSRDYDKFRKTQLYYYQNLTTKLESFLDECKIEFEILDFQADHYLENPFIEKIEPLKCLEIINNTGTDLTANAQQCLINILKHQGIDITTFYNSGKTISTYERIEVEGEDTPCWKITEVIPWSSIELDRNKNYLVFNKILESETGSMAYQSSDGLWIPSRKTDNQEKVDFYSQLKKRFNYLEKGEFSSFQGINMPEVKIVDKKQSNPKNTQPSVSVLYHEEKKIDRDILREDTKAFTNGKFLELDDYIYCYLSKQENPEELKKFINKYNLKISSEFQKVFIELGIKNWMRQSIANSSIGLPIVSKSFSEKSFFSIYVRSRKNNDTKDNDIKAVAVEFTYKEGCIYIKRIMRDVKQIRKKFKFLRTQKNNPEKLINAQQYLVDESEKIFISCYTSDNFTPTLIGRHGILEELEEETLEINRSIQGENSSKLLPVISYYSIEIKPIKRIRNMLCFDLRNEDFIQYYVPPAQSLGRTIQKGFRVYHFIGKTYSGESIPTSKLIEHPLTALHFSTLTKNILKISENSQSSILQKVPKVLVEN